MKKFLSVFIALVMVFSLAVPAFAVTNSSKPISVPAAKDKNGSAVAIKITEVEPASKPVVDSVVTNSAKLEDAMKEAGVANSIVAQTENYEAVACEVKIDGDPAQVTFPVELQFNVPQAANAEVVAVLHYIVNTSEWEKISFSQSGTSISGVFGSLSPVVFVMNPIGGNGGNGGNGGSSAVSPKTGDLPVEYALMGIMALCVAGVVYSTRRRRA